MESKRFKIELEYIIMQMNIEKKYSKKKRYSHTLLEELHQKVSQLKLQL